MAYVQGMLIGIAIAAVVAAIYFVAREASAQRKDREIQVHYRTATQKAITGMLETQGGLLRVLGEQHERAAIGFLASKGYVVLTPGAWAELAKQFKQGQTVQEWLQRDKEE